MRGLIKSVAAVALLTFFLQPLAACFSPEMTQTDEECCRQMAGDCGQVSMPTSHSCCKFVDRSGSARPEAKSTIVQDITFSLVPPEPHPLVSHLVRSVAIEPSAESPPQSNSRSIQVLRI